MLNSLVRSIGESVGDQEEMSLGEQVTLWEKSDCSYDKVHSILYSDFTPRHSYAAVPPHVFSDLEYFTSNAETDNGRTVLQSLGKTQTPYGECVLQHLLRHPLISPEAIKERQWIIRKFYDTPKLMSKLEGIWANFKNPQDLLWFWREEDENAQTLYDLVYFKTPLISHYINSSESFLMGTSIYKIFVSPAAAILTPLLCFIVPYVLVRYMGFPISFSQIFHLLKHSVFSVSFLSNKTATMATISAIVWFVLYGYNAYTIYQYAALTNRVTNIIHQKLQVAANAVKASRDILQLSSYYPQNIKDLLAISECDLETEVLLMRDTIFAKPSLFRNKGCILSTFWKIKKYLPDLAKRSRFLGYIDAFYSIAYYLRKAEKAGLYWTYSLFGEKKRVVKKFWHPILWKEDKKQKPTPNSINLKKKVRALMLTGPNAAGKSTLVRTLLVNSLFSQTLGVALAKEWKMPNTFFFIDTYLNVPDVEGHSSLFQAEMFRCMEFLQALETMKNYSKGTSSCRAIIALDEVFSSTNYKEGFSAAYAVIEYLANHFPDLFCLITTHFHGLTTLEKDTKGKIKNYCLQVNRDKDGKILDYPFKVKRGVSKEHVALDLLEKNGFSHSILNTARRIYNSIEQPDYQARDHLSKHSQLSKIPKKINKQ
jgi:energy-coupling factor transporter ATP-binding protein EcfA2